jgi:RNA polymerase sigma-70 factor (ECF subfamily)
VPSDNLPIPDLAPGAPDLADLLKRLQAQDEDAARAIYNRYTAGLLALARQNLQLVKFRVDPESVVQSVYRSFFQRQRAGEYELGSWNGLWALLTRITLRKCWNRVRYHRQQCRDLRREVSVSGEDELASLVAMDPSPSQAAVLAETVAGLLNGLRDRERHIIELLLRGYDVEEICVQARCGERTARRVRDRFKARLEDLLREEN